MKKCFTLLKEIREIKNFKITYQFLPQRIVLVGIWRNWHFHILVGCYKLVYQLFGNQPGMWIKNLQMCGYIFWFNSAFQNLFLRKKYCEDVLWHRYKYTGLITELKEKTGYNLNLKWLHKPKNLLTNYGISI